MLSLVNINKKYKSLPILKDINLNIKENEKIGIMGVNGSGKTTLAEIIFGVIKPNKGKIIFSNSNIVIKNAVFQDVSFDGELKLRSIFKFFCSALKVKCDNKKISEKFEKFELENQLNLRYSNLSGGQKQKFKFLIALLNNPNFLLLDELTTHLDYEWKIKIVDLVTKYLDTKECVLLLISHDSYEVAKLCDRVIVIKDNVINKDFKLSSNFEESLLIIKKMVYDNDCNN
ncbi:ABC transporter ATP-binding protein [Entomoplasma ellychniae]|uniref:ABC transporter ATP-binding protein n=1 Tax=Entomoplasma ellychniae TaxID=2114 RepID=A0A8E2QX17_9MOLU|nr:ABC transporter ATP-binding protein [Entomoplasma ellychniae]PPE04483.1 ABC transporter ATP-binding protein [Entomoplasma ellychniae]